MSRRGLSLKQKDIIKFFPAITFDRSSEASRWYYYITSSGSKMFINCTLIGKPKNKIQLTELFHGRPEKIVTGDWEYYYDPEDVDF